ncbi:MAG: hydantoinase/oxoprolinase family protein [Pseudomonadota bacterium]|nr:MAG: hydantoinase/oxoprolinase family protein [Pseudomonadota bacterium]
MLLGVDTGGTFTDFVLLAPDGVRIHKVLSTPQAPEHAILQGIADLGIDAPHILRELTVVHGSTVATNAALEGKGVRTVFITNRGLRDLLTLGRQARADLYDLQPQPPAPPVPRELCLETGGRVAADSTTVEPLTQADLAALTEQVRRLAPQSVAINLLFSWLDDAHERAIEQALGTQYFISRSSTILPEYREYERGVTTWLNAWVGPLVAGYLRRLSAGLPGAQVSVMQSSGGTISAEQAAREAVHMLLSGPAGGLAGARFVGHGAGRTRLLTFDMGGTSTDVALIDGALQLTSEGHIGRYPVAVPMVDMHTIGAGGGSIARVDAGGLLQVGPESAGADPGPACYGHGGTRATVTDANLVLGRLRADAFLGGNMTLDEAAARIAVGEVAERLDLTPEEAAVGILRVANEHMTGALRVMSVQRGVDPRELTLVSFGGAGGLHVCALADSLGMSQAMVPVHAGVLSALGMLAAPRERRLSRTVNHLLADVIAGEVDARLASLEAQGRDALGREGVASADITVERSADLRYAGQSYSLTVAWRGVPRSAQQFHDEHERRYGHRLDLPVELVNLRVALRSRAPHVPLAWQGNADAAAAPRQVRLYGIHAPVAVLARVNLTPGRRVEGPALITETVSTTFLSEGWRAVVDPDGNLLLERT